MKINKKYVGLVIIIFIGIITMVFFGIKKEKYDGDELYTYTLSNSRISGFMGANVNFNDWNSSSKIENSFALNRDEIFSIRSIYVNQENDVHPPFYYLIFHSISIFFLNIFSKWAGLILNIICYIITTIFIFKLSDGIFPKKEKLTQLLPCLFYSISIGAISTVMFIRMYMMLTMFCVMFIYYFFKIYMENEGKLDYIKLCICIYLGFMTHYFFITFAFFMCCIYVLYLIFKRKYKRLLKFSIYAIFGIILGAMTFPSAYDHIFGGYRGTESQSNLVKSSIISNFNAIYGHLNSELFLKLMIPILIIYIVSSIVIMIKNKFKFDKINLFILLLNISLILYTMVTVKIISILSTRYLYCTYPFFILVFCYVLNLFINKVINYRFVKSIMISVFLVLAIITLISTNPSWTESIDNNIKQEFSEYKDYDLYYFSTNDYFLIGDSQYLLKYNKVYMIPFGDMDIKKINTKIFNNCKDNFLVSIPECDESEEILNIILEESKCNRYTKLNFGYLFQK